jgi:glucokinase
MAIGLGLDVGGTKILGCATNETGELIAEMRSESPATRSGLLDALESSFQDLVGKCVDTDDEIGGVGIGLPGLVDAAGVLHEVPNMKAAEGLVVRSELKPRFQRVLDDVHRSASRGLTVIVDNDATCAAAGEMAFGAARNVANAVVVTLGTGIGGGVIANGKLMRGEHGFAGEFGHIVVAPDGPPCVCGGRGCWEQFVSGSGLQRIAREAVASGKARGILTLARGNLENVSAEVVVQAARDGDEDARDLVEIFARYLSIGLSNIAEILDPEWIILSGGLIGDADVLISPALAHFGETRRGSGENRVRVELAQLGKVAGSLGAAALALGLVS